MIDSLDVMIVILFLIFIIIAVALFFFKDRIKELDKHLKRLSFSSDDYSECPFIQASLGESETSISIKGKNLKDCRKHFDEIMQTYFIGDKTKKKKVSYIQ